MDTVMVFVTVVAAGLALIFVYERARDVSRRAFVLGMLAGAREPIPAVAFAEPSGGILSRRDADRLLPQLEARGLVVGFDQDSGPNWEWAGPVRLYCLPELVDGKETEHAA